jgi:hypothetical protein
MIRRISAEAHKVKARLNAGPSYALLHYFHLAISAVKAANYPYQNDDRDRNTEEP